MYLTQKHHTDWIHLGLTIFFIATAIFILAPLIIVVVTSFDSTGYNIFPPTGFSLRWYVSLLQHPEFLLGFKNSIIVGFVASVIAVTAAVLAALAFIRYRFTGVEMIKSFFLSPVVVPKIVLGLSLFILFLKIKIFGTLFSVIMAHAVITMPFALAVLIGTISSLDPRLEEAAQDLGAKTWQGILFIILPQIKIGLAISFLFAFITSFDQIDTTIFLVRPAINTLPVEMFIYMELRQDPTMAALATLMLAFSLLMVLLARPLFGRFTETWTKRGNER
jgi:putative spermidine/putrescine transport system permease protein